MRRAEEAPQVFQFNITVRLDADQVLFAMLNAPSSSCLTCCMLPERNDFLHPPERLRPPSYPPSPRHATSAEARRCSAMLQQDLLCSGMTLLPSPSRPHWWAQGGHAAPAFQKLQEYVERTNRHVHAAGLLVSSCLAASGRTRRNFATPSSSLLVTSLPGSPEASLKLLRQRLILVDSGMGNMFQSLVSAFLSAYLTDRVSFVLPNRHGLIDIP